MSNAVASRTSHNEEVISPHFSTSEPAGFLFVNETDSAATYKQGNRHDIRSHVRKVVAKQFRKTHKIGPSRATTLPKYAPLTSQGLDSEASKPLEHDRDCPLNISRIPRRGRGLSTAWDSGSVYESPKLIGFSESAPDATPLSKVTELPKASEIRGDNTMYCKACGKPLKIANLKQRYLSKDRSLIPRRPNPVGALGAGRIDPFSSLPMHEQNHYSQELMDHSKCRLFLERSKIQLISYFYSARLSH
jgi:hypothetical protein